MGSHGTSWTLLSNGGQLSKSGEKEGRMYKEGGGREKREEKETGQTGESGKGKGRPGGWKRKERVAGQTGQWEGRTRRRGWEGVEEKGRGNKRRKEFCL